VAVTVASAALLSAAAGCVSPTGGPSRGSAPSPSASSRTRLATPKLIFKTAGRASAQNACFSPDGTRVLFTLFHEGYNDGPAGLYVVSLDGGRPREVLDEPETDNVNLPGTSWNAATDRIVFASDREGTDEVWTATPAGKDLFRVTRRGGPRQCIEPSFSPDGRWIAFEAGLGGPDEGEMGSILKIRADGLKRSRLTVAAPIGAATRDDRLPNWSPQGDRILFQRRGYGSEDWDIFTMTPDGKGPRAVTGTSAGADTDASWSPDGKWICYSSDFGNLPAANIFIIPAEGGRPVRVTRSATEEHAAPSFSPDGRWIAFECHRVGEDGEAAASLWRVRAPRL